MPDYLYVTKRDIDRRKESTHSLSHHTLIQLSLSFEKQEIKRLSLPLPTKFKSTN